MIAIKISYIRRQARKIINAPVQIVSAARRRWIRKKIFRQKQRSTVEYNSRPKVTAIVQFFNKKENATRIVSNLIDSGIEEIIVIDDGSVDGSYDYWPRLLKRKNDFLLRCNDIYEIRAYDRAIRMANGHYVVLLQDDDIPPDNSKWLRDAITLFENYEDLVILGGRDGLEILPAEPATAPIKHPTRENPIYSYPALHKYRIVGHPRFFDPNSGIPFEFIDSINRAPMFVRTSAYFEGGGMPIEYAPIICDDVAASLRAWRQDQKVGLYHCDFRRFVSPGGMREFNVEFGRTAATRNWRRLYDDFSLEIESGLIRRKARKACEDFLSKK